ncbi:MAG: S8 family serine peptidase [Verrucomicrobiota bacterium]|jgi:hypothetical protein
MRTVPRFWFAVCALALPLAVVAAPSSVHSTDTNSLFWRVKEKHVDAQMQDWELSRVLKKIASATGWKVFVEPGTAQRVSVKFKNLPEDEALRRLLGKLNYFRDETNGVSRLFVFQTVSGAATQMVQAEKKDYRIPDELLVKMKGGPTNLIDQLAKQVGATVIGRNDKIGFYRLQFADAAAADSALQSLADNSAVAAADANYLVDPPSPVQMTQAGAAPAGPFFNLNPPDLNGPVVGLIDTSVAPPDQFQKYMLTPVSVVGTPDPPTDQPSHGTAMLETMLGSMAADPSMIQPVTVYSDTQSTSTYDLMNGIIKAINLGDNPISISSGGTGNSAVFGDLIAEAQQKGIQFVASTGNSGANQNDYPAAYPGVISVTASGPNGQLASYANDGPGTMAMEPGTSMIVYGPLEWYVEGTSPAAAEMSALIAQMENQNHISAQASAAIQIKANPAPAPR